MTDNLFPGGNYQVPFGRIYSFSFSKQIMTLNEKVVSSDDQVMDPISAQLEEGNCGFH